MRFYHYVFTISFCVIMYAQEINPKKFDYPYDVRVFDLPQSSNGVKYRIYVRPPLRKSKDEVKPSSFYFLDPLRLFVPAAAMTYNYEYFNYHPASYFIGIGYQNEADGIPKESNRTRDYTPTAFDPPEGHFLASNPVDYEGSGGCDAFLRVIEEEIIPFIENRYNVNQDRVLIGKSMSGLAAVHGVLSKPNLFNRYVIVSPAIWWDDWLYPRHERYVMRQVEQVDVHEFEKETRVYFAVGEEEERLGLVTDLYVLTNALKNLRIANLKVNLQVLEQEQHEGVFPSAFMKGIVGVYADQEGIRKSSTKLEWE